MATQLASESSYPTAKLCMMFTDIEGSTELVQTCGDSYPKILSRHFELLRTAIQQQDGQEVQTVGDSIFAVFPESHQAVQAAIDSQLALLKERWAHGGKLRVRMGLHNGTVQIFEDAIVGIEVHRAARISSVGQGGQIVVSDTVREEIKDETFHPMIRIHDMGFHRLKDLRYPEPLFDLEVNGLPHEFDALRSGGAIRTNLPSETMELFGRDQETDEIRRVLSTKSSRLVTLSGTGGAGKTSLAIAIGRDLVGSFARGVFFVQLGAVSNADLIAPAIAQSLGIHEQAGVPAHETIKKVIGDGELLVILDTFEHVIDASGLIIEMLEDCPNISFMITSREALNIKPEKLHVVNPLSVPPVDASFETISRNDAVQLFVSLAQREQADFDLTPETAGSISTICRRLDGLPLAIALAAARAGFIDPKELAERLMARLADLRSLSRDADPRHRTLFSAIEWSDHLLTENERRCFYKLSVFSGGFDVSAAEFVVEGNGDKIELLEDLRSLASKNLLVRTASLGRPRLSMLDTIHEYAHDALARSLGDADTRERHALYFTGLVEEAAPHVMNEDQRDYVELLFLETGNISAALNWLIDQSNAQQTARLLGALKWFWISRGQFSEAQRWTDLALSQMRNLDDLASLAAISDVTGWVRFMSGDAGGALEPAMQSLRIYKQLGDRSGIASASIMAGLAKSVAGQVPEGPNHIFESLELFRELGDRHGTSVALIAIGEGLRGDGKEEEAERYYQEALGPLTEIGNTFWRGMLSQNIAHFRLHTGDWRDAANLVAEAIAIGEQYDYPMMLNLSVAAASGVVLAKGDAIGSARIVGSVEARLASLGVHFEPADNADLQRIKAAARSELGEKAFATALAEGATADWDDTLVAARACSSEI